MKRSVLIIEDEKGIVDTISYSLGTEGFETISASTGEEGMVKLAKAQVDCVVLDIGLPDISGFDLIKQIRLASDVPVIVLTARTEEVDRVLGLELGADDYLVKPFSPRELSARVKAVLRRSRNREGGGSLFTIDRNKRRISFCGKALDLSRYEYEILALFLKKPGWVFSRDQIMESAWEEPGESFDRTVDSHIKTLRAKLRSVNRDIDPIVTHRGIGYSVRDGQ